MGHVLLIVINLCCAMAWLTDAKQNPVARQSTPTTYSPTSISTRWFLRLDTYAHALASPNGEAKKRVSQ